MTSVAGRVVIVTGSTAGIGAATAARLAADGWSVVVSGRRRALGDAVVAAICAKGGTAVFVPADVSVVADADRLVKEAVEAFARLDAVVNNAAAFHYASLETTSDDDWRRVIDTNIGGAFRVSRAAIPHLRLAGDGVIVNVSSVHAFATMEQVAAYAASKGAIVSLSRQMALDLSRDRIRVVPLIVGGVETEMAHQHLAALGLTVAEAGFSHDDRVIGRIGAPEEIAAAIAFLLSRDASFVNGSPFVVDGGLLARL
jgi:NAD(P)-dependent dehydrogenase (short-subunit alcohol dehydrogenase family)